MTLRVLLSGIVLFVMGCATPTPYQKANILGKGYNDQKLDRDKFRVSFKGNKLTERDTVETYLVYRAAEFTLEQGYSYFRMIQWNTDRHTQHESISPVVYGYYAQNTQMFPYYVYGNPMMVRGGTMESNEYEAVAFVTMAEKLSAEQAEVYYNAKQVLENLKDKIIRPDH